MATPKNFLQDRTALLLTSGNAFLALVATVLVLLKVGSGQGTGSYIVSYRSSLGLDAYRSGTKWDVASFILFGVMVFAIGVLLAYQTYPIKRELALTILGLTVPLLVLLIIVANSLLVLH